MLLPCEDSTLPLPKCFTTEQSSRLPYSFHDKECNNLPTHTAEFLNQTLFSKGAKVASTELCSRVKNSKISQSQSVFELFEKKMIG